VEDADQAVAELAQGGVVADLAVRQEPDLDVGARATYREAWCQGWWLIPIEGVGGV
jgi:hypothetical protein